MWCDNLVSPSANTMEQQDPFPFTPSPYSNALSQPPPAASASPAHSTTMENKKPIVKLATTMETETENVVPFMNLNTINKLLRAQMIASAVILLAQVFLYSIERNYRYGLLGISGIGIWAPMFIFSVASGLTHMAIKAPPGCIPGTAMAFQIATVIFGSILTMLATISLALQRGEGSDVFERIVCSSIIFGGIGLVMSAMFVSIQLCRVICCGTFVRRAPARTLL